MKMICIDFYLVTSKNKQTNKHIKKPMTYTYTSYGIRIVSEVGSHLNSYLRMLCETLDLIPQGRAEQTGEQEGYAN